MHLCVQKIIIKNIYCISTSKIAVLVQHVLAWEESCEDGFGSWEGLFCQVQQKYNDVCSCTYYSRANYEHGVQLIKEKY